MSYAKAEFDDKTLQEELLALQQAAAQEDWAQHECMAAIERAQVAVSALQGELLEADEDDGEAPDSEMEALRNELAACEDEAARAEEEARAREEEAAEQDEEKTGKKTAQETEQEAGKLGRGLVVPPAAPLPRPLSQRRLIS